MKREGIFWLIIAAIAVGAVVVLESGYQAKQDETNCTLPECDQIPRGAQAGVVMDLPPELREPNWGGGSCVHASTVMVLRWQGQYELADWWRENYIGGEYSDRLIKRMEAANLRYAYTLDSDFEFIRWAMRTGRGCGIFYKPNHAICAVGLDDQYVYLLDNNDVDRPEREGTPERVPVDEFIRRWRGYGGFAWTVVYTPNPPEPTL